jgi:chemotaxis signal transduction protein
MHDHDSTALQQLHPFDQLAAMEARLEAAHTPGPSAGGEAIFAGLGFRVGPWHLTVSMEPLAEVLRSETITRVPGAKAWFRGVMNLRGTVLSVTDLGSFVDSEPASESLSGRVLVFRSETWMAGLEVHEVFGLCSFRLHERVSDPEPTGSLLDDYRVDAFEAEGKTWLALDPARLLSDSRFRAAAA